MHHCLRSAALSQVYLSLTLQHSQTIVANLKGVLLSQLFRSSKIVHNHNFSIKLHVRNESQKELAIVLPYPVDSDLPYRLRQAWRHAQDGDCDHCSEKKLNNWLQCWWSLRCFNQSVHVYQNCLWQSWECVYDGTCDHCNYMETRLNSWSPYRS